MFQKSILSWILWYSTRNENRIKQEKASVSFSCVSYVVYLLCFFILNSSSFAQVAQEEEETYTPHYVQTTVKNLNADGEKLVVRKYIDGYGRNLQTQKKLNNSEQGFSTVTSGMEYDELNRPSKKVKPFGYINADDPLEYITKELSSDPGCAVNYYNGLSGRANAEGYPYSEYRYNDDPYGGRKIIGAAGKAYSLQPESGHPVKIWYFGVTGDDITINGKKFFDENGFILPAFLIEGPEPTTDYLNIIIPMYLELPGVDRKFFLSVYKDGSGNFSQILNDKSGNVLRSWLLNWDDDKPIVSKFTYDVLGRIKEETPPATESKVSIAPTLYTYNTLSQLESCNTPDAGTVSYSYDKAGRIQEVIDQVLTDQKFKMPTGTGDDEIIQPRLHFEYDVFGRHVTISRNEPSTSIPSKTKWCTWVRNIYDDPEAVRPFLSTSSFPQGAGLDVILNSCANTRGRVVATISYDSKFYTYRTDASHIENTESLYGNKVIDLFSYDDEGRIIRKYKSIPGIPLQIRKYGYDLHSRLIADTIEMGESERKIATRYTYDGEGRLCSIYRDDKLFITYTYDDLGRLLKKTFIPESQSSRSISYSYTINEWTKKISASNEIFFEELCYETNDISIPLRSGLRFSPQFSGAISRARSLTGTNGQGNNLDLLYFYDKANRLVQATNNSGDDVFDATFQYRNDGRFIEKHEGRDQVPWGEYVYYPKEGTSYETNRLKSIPGSGKGDVNTANYIYDPNGNMVLDKSKRMLIEYDWRNMPVCFYMFTDAVDLPASNWEEAKLLYSKAWTLKVVMTYDAVGNRVKKETFANDLPQTLEAQNESPLLFTNTINDDMFELNPDGTVNSNRIVSNFEQTSPDGALLVKNNGEERLALSNLALQVSGTISGNNSRPVVDGDLTSTLTESQATQFAINADGGGVVLSGPTESGSFVTGVSYVDGSHTLTRSGPDADYELSYVNFSDGISLPDNNFELHVKDHLGSTRAVVTEDGMIKEASAYLAYGEEKEIRGTASPTRQKYTGKELDLDGVAIDGKGNRLTCGIGLNYFGARYYDPEIGVWTSTDPVNEFWNSYSYVGADPVNKIDPSGMFSVQSQPVSMFVNNIGRYAGTASVMGTFTNMIPVIVIINRPPPPLGGKKDDDDGKGRRWTEGVNDDYDAYCPEDGLIDYSRNKKPKGGGVGGGGDGTKPWDGFDIVNTREYFRFKDPFTNTVALFAQRVSKEHALGLKDATASESRTVIIPEKNPNPIYLDPLKNHIPGYVAFVPLSGVAWTEENVLPMFLPGGEAYQIASLLKSAQLAKLIRIAAKPQVWKGLITELNQARFWTGLRNGWKEAWKYTELHGGRTLEQILAERGIDMPTWDPNNEVVIEMWREISREFAMSAQGDVIVLMDKDIFVGSVFMEIEFPALKANLKVTSVTAIDVNTGEKVLLWKR